MINPYETLGVKKNATAAEIKAAYRRLAKKNHPDLNPGNQKAEQKFKEVSHAHDLIGNSISKAKFDAEEEKSRPQGNSRRPQPEQSTQFHDSFSAEDFFQNMFRANENRTPPTSMDLHYKMSISFKESIIGSEKVITLVNGKNLQVKIPPGITSGFKLRFKSQGAYDHDLNIYGDVYIEVEIQRLSGWQRVGNDIETELPLSFIEGLLGTEISVPTMHGPVMLKIPSGVTTGSQLRIKAKGVLYEQVQGNQIVKIKIVLPKKLVPEQISAILEIKTLFNYNPRNEV